MHHELRRIPAATGGDPRRLLALALSIALVSGACRTGNLSIAVREDDELLRAGLAAQAAAFADLSLEEVYDRFERFARAERNGSVRRVEAPGTFTIDAVAGEASSLQVSAPRGASLGRIELSNPDYANAVWVIAEFEDGFVQRVIEPGGTLAFEANTPIALVAIIAIGLVGVGALIVGRIELIDRVREAPCRRVGIVSCATCQGACIEGTCQATSLGWCYFTRNGEVEGCACQ